jgi:hypothetical protein
MSSPHGITLHIDRYSPIEEHTYQAWTDPLISVKMFLVPLVEPGAYISLTESGIAPLKKAIALHHNHYIFDLQYNRDSPVQYEVSAQLDKNYRKDPTIFNEDVSEIYLLFDRLQANNDWGMWEAWDETAKRVFSNAHLHTLKYAVAVLDATVLRKSEDRDYYYIQIEARFPNINLYVGLK